MYNTPQKLIAEFLGTFALIFFGAGSICTDQYLHGAGGGLGLLGIALAHGLAIAIMVSALGHISGGHFNPAITIGFWVTKRVNTVDTILYWAAQLAGAVQVLIGADGAGAKENQRKRSKEFRDQFLRRVVHR